MAEIEIDGKKVVAEPGSMIIEAADHIGIWIPRFCYHKKLSIAANCRMCLVDVEKAPKPLPACATPITEGMKIRTRSEKALLAQKAVMEFLLINHPLDCPICDQGGECELQDISMGYGADVSRYTEGKRVVVDQNLGPLVATDMTRCIQCTRCVRFGSEIAGKRELGATGRGEHLAIRTFVEENINSEVSGNVIDLCPVGALTSKPFRFKARAWELKQTPSIAPHDCIGSNIFVHSRVSEVMRVVPRENEEINEVWLSDRDRFSYEGVTEDRLQRPKIKLNGQWQEVSFAEALSYCAEQIKEQVSSDPKSIGALASPSLTIEEYYLLQKLMRSLGSHNIDHRLRQNDFTHANALPLFPSIGMNFPDLESQSLVVLVGSDCRNEQPVLNLKLRKMVDAGKKVCVINPIDFEFNFKITDKSIVKKGDLKLGLLGILKILSERVAKELPQEVQSLISEIKPSQIDNIIADHLLTNEKSSMILGALALNVKDASLLLCLANWISYLSGATLGTLTSGANSAGAWLAGCLPHRLPGGKSDSTHGFSTDDMLNANLNALILLEVEPEADFAQKPKQLEALKKIPFIVACTSFESENIKEIASVLLPIASFGENGGTFVNAEGRWQKFEAVVAPLGESRPLWKILRVLANLLELPNFEYHKEEEILTELSELIFSETKTIVQSGEKKHWDLWSPLDHNEDKDKDKDKDVLNKDHEQSKNYKQTEDPNEIMWFGQVPLYACDGIVRRAFSLQQTKQAQCIAKMNKRLGEQHDLQTGDFAEFSTQTGMTILPIEIDEGIPDQIVFISYSNASRVLGEPYQSIKIEKVMRLANKLGNE